MEGDIDAFYAFQNRFLRTFFFDQQSNSGRLNDGVGIDGHNTVPGPAKTHLARESHPHAFLNSTITNLRRNFKLVAINRTHDSRANRSGVFVVDTERLLLFQGNQRKRTAFRVAIGPEIVVIVVETISLESDPFAVAFADTEQGKRATLEHEALAAYQPHLVLEARDNSWVDVGTYKKKTALLDNLPYTFCST